MMYDNVTQREKHLVMRTRRWTETDEMAEPKSSTGGEGVGEAEPSRKAQGPRMMDGEHGGTTCRFRQQRQ